MVPAINRLQIPPGQQDECFYQRRSHANSCPLCLAATHKSCSELTSRAREGCVHRSQHAIISIKSQAGQG